MVGSGSNNKGKGEGGVGGGSFRRILHSVVERLSFFNRLNPPDEDSYNLYKALGYPRSISLKQYRARYRRGGVATRIVNFLPSATWIGGVYLIEDENPKKITPFEKQAESLFQRLQVPQVFRRADIQAGLGNYAGVVIGAKGDLSKPLPKLRGPDDILFLRPYGQDRLTIRTLDEDPNSQRNGLIDTYKLDLRPDTTSKNNDPLIKSLAKTAADMEKVIHHSRVIHIAKNCIDSDFYGTPDLESIWNLLEDLYRVTGGGAKSAWNRALSKVLMDLDKDVDPKNINVEELEEELDKMYDDSKSYVLGRAMTPKPIHGPVFTFSSNAASVLAQISGATGIPMRRLTGSERGELASENDKEIEANLVFGHRVLNCDGWMRDFGQRMIDCGALPQPTSFQPEWYEEESPLSETEKAEVVYKLALANKLQVANGDTPVTSSDEMRDTYYGRKPLKWQKIVPPSNQPLDTPDDI